MLARLAAPALLALGLGLSSTAQAAWMWTGWEDINGNQEQCLQTAAVRLREIGFTPTVTPQTTFAWRGQDGVSVRCIAERRVAAIFVYVSTDREEGSRILDQLRAAYTAVPAAPTTPSTPRPGSGGKF